jgi:hypothetical protein
MEIAEMKNRTALQRTINKLPELFDYPQAIAACIAQGDIDEAFRLSMVMQREVNSMKRDYLYASRKADRH